MPSRPPPPPTLRPERIAHRGAPREFYENTLDGFVRALERGADAVELDVHKTRDDTVVIHHDADVSLASDTRAPISALTWADLCAVRLADGARIPTLAQVMDALGDRATVYVELKGEDVGDAAVRVARAHGTRYAFHSFDHSAVLRLRASYPDLHYGALFDAGTADVVRRMATLNVRDIWPHWSLVNIELVTAARAAGKRLLVWTVDDVAEASRLTALGVDGLCTDDVRILS